MRARVVPYFVWPFVLLCGLAAAGSAVGQIDSSAADIAALKGLDEKVSIDLSEELVQQLIEQIEAQTEARFAFDRDKLENSGLGSFDGPITFSVRNISARSVLDLVLPKSEVDWRVMEGKIEVWLPDETDFDFRTVRYDVADLLRDESSPRGNAPCGLTRRELSQLIKRLVSPLIWTNDLGGKIEWNGDSLELFSETSVHEGVSNLLKALRRIRRRQVAHVLIPAWRDTDRSWLARGRIGRALRSSWPEVFIETPIVDIAEACQDDFGIPIVVEKRALEKLDHNVQPVATMDGAGKTLRECWDEMLTPLGLGWVIRHEVLFITSRQWAEAEHFTRLFPIHDLLPRSAEEAARSAREVAAGVRAADPRSWQGYGSEFLFYEPNMRLLIVTRNADVQARTAEFILKLRREKLRNNAIP